MKRALAFAALLVILAPIAGAVAMACTSMACCAEHQDRVSRPMDCCQPTMCSTETSAANKPAVEKPAAPAAATADFEIATLDAKPHTRTPHFEAAISPPRTNSVRLALIATLLI